MGCSTFVVVSLLAVIVAKSVAFIWVAPFLALMVAIVVANSRK
jgi:hypothetical protein